MVEVLLIRPTGTLQRNLQRLRQIQARHISKPLRKRFNRLNPTRIRAAVIARTITTLSIIKAWMNRLTLSILPLRSNLGTSARKNRLTFRIQVLRNITHVMPETTRRPLLKISVSALLRLLNEVTYHTSQRHLVGRCTPTTTPGIGDCLSCRRQ